MCDRAFASHNYNTKKPAPTAKITTLWYQCTNQSCTAATVRIRHLFAPPVSTQFGDMTKNDNTTAAVDVTSPRSPPLLPFPRRAWFEGGSGCTWTKHHIHESAQMSARARAYSLNIPIQNETVHAAHRRTGTRLRAIKMVILINIYAGLCGLWAHDRAAISLRQRERDRRVQGAGACSLLVLNHGQTVWLW